MDYRLIILFGALAVVVVVSALIFRRRSLGTVPRVVLSVVAVGMLGTKLVRDGGVTVGALALTAAAALILGSGIIFLRRVEQERPPAE